MRCRLGKTDIEVTSVGLGCWQFSAGQGLAGKFWEAIPQSVVDQVVEASLAGGINWFDTAEMYGNGASERALAAALRHAGKTNGEVVVATKWSPILRTAESIRSTIRQRLTCLAPFAIDLHQVHNPLGFSSIEAEMNAMADLVADKKIRAVGVSNFNVTRMRRAHAALANYGLALASNQVHYSLLNRTVEKNGTLARCKELGIRLIAYSPIEKGLLAGKYSPEKPPPGSRARQYANLLPKLPPLLRLMTIIGQDHGGKSTAEVALNWLVCKGALPIPGAKNAEQALQNAGALGWRLAEEEIVRLDEATDLIASYFQVTAH